MPRAGTGAAPAPAASEEPPALALPGAGGPCWAPAGGPEAAPVPAGFTEQPDTAWMLPDGPLPGRAAEGPYGLPLLLLLPLTVRYDRDPADCMCPGLWCCMWCM